MATKQNFADILDKPASQIERPKPLPQGTYSVVVAGIPRQDKSAKKETPFVEFTYNILAAGDDVDADELAAFGGIEGKTIKDTYYITEGSAFRLKDMLTHAGVMDEKKSMRKMIEDTPGCQLIVSIRHEASQDGQSVFARVNGTAPAE